MKLQGEALKQELRRQYYSEFGRLFNWWASEEGMRLELKRCRRRLKRYGDPFYKG